MRRALPWALVAAVVATLGAACDDGATSDPGLLATVRVSGAQYVEGAMPGGQDGPVVAAAELLSNTVMPGQNDRSLRGALGASSTAVAIGVRGDPGYWVHPSEPPDLQAPAYPSFDVMLSFSPDAPLGSRDLVVRAVDEGGRFGPETVRVLDVVATDVAGARLVVTLRWDSQSDLDLHVVDPTGAEVFYRDINSAKGPTPGRPVDPQASLVGGVLDVDSNCSCVVDGRRRENVVWKVPPPSGHYEVRVDTFSLCGEGAARWAVDAVLDGRSLGRASGTSVSWDTRAAHDRGAGVLALGFDVP